MNEREPGFGAGGPTFPDQFAMKCMLLGSHFTFVDLVSSLGNELRIFVCLSDF